MKKLKQHNLKKFITCLQVCFVLLFSTGACQQELVVRVGFDTVFEKNSTGISNLHVNNNALTVNLTGEITLNDGQVLVELINSAGVTVFATQIITPGNFSVNESYPAVQGNWKLKYKSTEGTGLLILHLTDSY
jgi:hypothetical protein